MRWKTIQQWELKLLRAYVKLPNKISNTNNKTQAILPALSELHSSNPYQMNTQAFSAKYQL